MAKIQYGVQKRLSDHQHLVTVLMGILEALPLMVVRIDAEGHLDFWNNHCRQVTGFSREELLQKTPRIGRLLLNTALVELPLKSSGIVSCHAERLNIRGNSRETWVFLLPVEMDADAYISLTNTIRQLSEQLQSLSGGPELPEFTPQETAVFNLLAEGSVNEEIRRKLGISKYTLQAYLRSLLQKSGLRSRMELIRYARDNMRRADPAAADGGRVALPPGTKPLPNPLHGVSAVEVSAGAGYFEDEMRFRAFIGRHGISRREFDTLRLVMQGYRNDEISVILNISLSTVKTHLYRVYRKLGIRKRSDLMILYDKKL